MSSQSRAAPRTFSQIRTGKKQALLQPEKDRARAEWLAKDAARKREQSRLRTQKWRAANPEKVKAFNDRENRRRKEERAARKQISARPELLGVQP